MKDIMDILSRTLQDAGAVLYEGYQSAESAYERKGLVDLVTKWDKESERVVRTCILDAFPTHAIYGEEGGGAFTRDTFLWIVDPLDGTTNFVHKHPYFCVSIACYENGRPLAGGVFAPVSGELFLAKRGSGAYLNDKKIQTSKITELNEALFVTGYPYKREGKVPKLQTLLANALHTTQCIRRMGSAALDLSHTGCGMFDVYIEFDLKPWDIAAGALILQEAGGRVTRMDGSDFSLELGEVCATNGLLHEKARTELLKGVI